MTCYSRVFHTQAAKTLAPNNPWLVVTLSIFFIPKTNQNAGFWPKIFRECYKRSPVAAGGSPSMDSYIIGLHGPSLPHPTAPQPCFLTANIFDASPPPNCTGLKSTLYTCRSSPAVSTPAIRPSLPTPALSSPVFSALPRRGIPRGLAFGSSLRIWTIWFVISKPHAREVSLRCESCWRYRKVLKTCQLRSRQIRFVFKNHVRRPSEIFEFYKGDWPPSKISHGGRAYDTGLTTEWSPFRDGF